MNKRSIYQLLSFFIYLLVQVLIMKEMVLFGRAFCFIYVAFLLLIPVETSLILLMLLGFVTGLCVDIFYDTMGIHAAACVLLMAIRNYWLKLITPQGGYDSGAVPTIRLNGGQWFSIYALVLIFIHHSVLFFIEAAGFGLFGFTLSKILLSTLFSFTAILISQYLFYNKRRV